MSAYIRKYGESTVLGTHVTIPIVKAGEANFALSADWTPAAGDVKVTKDDGTPDNISTLPAYILNQGWRFVFSAAELQCKKLDVLIVDSATKAIEDQYFSIETYGNASAMVPIDFSDIVRMGLTALPNAEAQALNGLYTRGTGVGQVNQDENGRIDVRVTPTGLDSIVSTATGVVEIAKAIWDRVLTGVTHNIANSGGRRLRELSDNIVITGISPNTGGTANTSIRIELDTNASAISGTYDPSTLCIVGGTGAGQCRQIWEFDGSNKYAYINRDWKTIPDNTSEYIILGSAGDTHVNEGLAQGGGANTITLNSLASSVDDTYNGQTCFISAGVGADQALRIIDYNGTTKVATLSRNWDTQPTSGSMYAVMPNTNILNDVPSSEILATALTESYSNKGATATLTQLLYEIIAELRQLAFSGTTQTIRKLDGTTPAYTNQIDNATTPTNKKRLT